MSKVRKALLFSVVTQHSTQFISLISIAILARLLTPAEIGVFAVAASVAFLAIELRALGVGQYLIREENICDEKIRSATGVMIVVSWSLALLIALCAPAIADFYSQQDLTVIFWIIASTFILAPFSGVPNALLSREMRFQPLFVIRFFTTIARAGSSIGFVLLGFSYYGLAMGILVGAIVELAITTYYRPANTPWIPTFSRFKELFRFGIFTSTANTLQQFSLSIPDLVLGRVATMTDVGLFSRGLGVIVFLNKILGQAVAPVVLPHLSEVKRTGGSVADAYLRAISLQAAFCWPVFAIVNLSAYSMINALFGDQWDAAVPIASALALWAILQSTHSFASYALMTEGRERLMFKKEIIVFVSRLSAVLIAAPHGLLMVAWAMVLAGVVEVIVNTWVVKYAIGISLRRFCVAFIPNVILAVTCWGVLKILMTFVDFEAINPWIALLIIGGCMVPVWLGTLYSIRHEAWKIVMQMLRRSSATPS